MSQSGVRASKRDIRKAFGPATLQTLVDLEEAIKAHTAQIRVLAELGARQGETIARHWSEWADDSKFQNELAIEHDKRLDRQHGILYRGFLGRLKWLFTGK